MKKFKEFNISFAGLKEGKHQFDFEIKDTFFETFEYDEVNDVSVHVNLSLEKKSTILELTFTSNGFVNVNCDLSNEPYDQKIKGNLYLVVKFGEDFNDESDEILILPYGEHQLNVAQYIYEMLVLAIPRKRIHPGVKDGTLETATLKKLEELELKENKKFNDGDIDPRWDQLKKLLTDK